MKQDKQTIFWVGWVKNGYISHLVAGPFCNEEDAQACANEWNEEEEEAHKRYRVVYSYIETRTNLLED